MLETKRLIAYCAPARPELAGKELKLWESLPRAPCLLAPASFPPSLPKQLVSVRTQQLI